MVGLTESMNFSSQLTIIEKQRQIVSTRSNMNTHSDDKSIPLFVRTENEKIALRKDIETLIEECVKLRSYVE